MASSVYMGTEPLVLKKKALGLVALKITLHAVRGWKHEKYSV